MIYGIMPRKKILYMFSSDIHRPKDIVIFYQILLIYGCLNLRMQNSQIQRDCRVSFTKVLAQGKKKIFFALLECCAYFHLLFRFRNIPPSFIPCLFLPRLLSHLYLL